MTKGRPRRPLLLQREWPDGRHLDVDLALGLWVVTYRGQMINLKEIKPALKVPRNYKRSAFGLPGHAFGLARKLNELYETTDFAVVLIRHGEGEPVEE